ncbi:hypothetical protein SprV_0100354700 [Sparganum proliferum]
MPADPKRGLPGLQVDSQLLDYVIVRRGNFQDVLTTKVIYDADSRTDHRFFISKRGTSTVTSQEVTRNQLVQHLKELRRHNRANCDKPSTPSLWSPRSTTPSKSGLT